jgi:hypothetical protein
LPPGCSKTTPIFHSLPAHKRWRTVWVWSGQSSWYRGILIASSSASSSVLTKVFRLVSSLFWWHMYDVLVYKMLRDRKKILNISSWRSISIYSWNASELRRICTVNANRRWRHHTAFYKTTFDQT